MDQDKINAYREEQKRKAQEARDKADQAKSIKSITGATSSGAALAATGSLIVEKAVNKNTEALKSVEGKVEVTNPDLAKTQDIDGVVESINKLNLTAFMQNDGLPQLTENLNKLGNSIQTLQAKYESEGLKQMSDQLSGLVKKLDEVSKTLSTTEIKVDKGFQKTIDGLQKSIDSIDFNPQVNVKAPETKVVTTPVDFKPVIEALGKVEKAVGSDESVDLGPVISGLEAVNQTIKNLRFPSANYILPFRDQDGKAVQVQLDSNNRLPVDATLDGDIEIGAIELKNGTDDTRATVLSGDSEQNALLVAPARKEVSFSTTTVQAVGTTDVSNFRSVSVQVTSQGGSSTVTFQGSNDNSTWVSVGMSISSAVGNTINVSSTTTAAMYYGPINYRYFRLNVTGIVSGTTAGLIEFSTMPYSPITVAAFVSSLSAGTTGPMKAEDVASATGDQGFPAYAIRRDTPVANANVSADGDYLPLVADNLGKAWTADNQVEDTVHASGDRGSFMLGVGNEAQTTLAADGDYVGYAVDTKGNTLTVGNVAHDGVDAGNPIKIGGRANTSMPASVADGDRVNAQFSKTGIQITRGSIREQQGNQQTTITASTAETTIITADATYFLDVYSIIVTNTSATATNVTIKDSTAGTTRVVIAVPANDIRGFALPVDSAHKQATVNNNWTATSSASVSSLQITALFVKNL